MLESGRLLSMLGRLGGKRYFRIVNIQQQTSFILVFPSGYGRLLRS
jgi:hypothetical protein